MIENATDTLEIITDTINNSFPEQKMFDLKMYVALVESSTK